MMNILDYLKDNRIILDGGMGTMLQKRGLAPGELPERWNISHPEAIIDIQKSYYDAGSNIVNTNTFGAYSLKFNDDELEKIISAAIANTREAAKRSNTPQPKWVALDMGPTGKMLKPYGDLDFEDAVEIFAKTVKLGAKYGADIISIETMNDSYETKAALLAAKENCDLPVFVSNSYGEDGKLMTGASPLAMIAMLEGMGADAIGINCSLGPKDLADTAREYLKYSSLPVIFKPNAGLPKSVDGKTVYDVEADEFAKDVASLMSEGVRIAGGCCGTTPEYIKALCRECKDIAQKPVTKKNISVVSSYTHGVIFGGKPVLIGERINPTGKKKFKEALRNKDIDYILNEGLSQQEKGVHLLDVNVGLPEIDEPDMLKNVIYELQAIIDLPLQIDTSDIKAMEIALRRYNGKAMVNSVNGKEESMNAVFPIVKKYGGLIVALTLDEDGIPENAEKRLEIAERILNKAKEYGIDKKDLIFDPLAMTVSADNNAAKETLKAVKLITEKLGCLTSLGVSNVSFGLPQRDLINGSFFVMALTNGLKAAIMNPYSHEMMKAYHTFLALNGMDESCAEYIEFTEKMPMQTAANTSAPVVKQSEDISASELQNSIIKGLKEQAAALTEALLKNEEPMKLIQNEIIPALNVVGERFEKKTIYLPQLLMSAEAAKAAFEIIKASSSSQNTADKCGIVIATVKGDIHDIGKNIVKLLLENYGFDVTDLGRDVAPETIVDTVIRKHSAICGLSALMTTTIPAMEETVNLIKEKAPWCKTVVGGAVLTPEYAASIGADKYAKDAMETVRYAEGINANL